MDFSLTKEQKLLKKVAAQFAETELEPVAADVDESHEFPWDNFQKMAKVGFTGIGVPREYGGVGGGMLEKVIAVSEFAKVCMTSAACLSIHLIAPHAIVDYGTEEQKMKYLPDLLSGKKLGFIAQEMGREINTTGSKSNQAEMQNIVVKMKDELEQIKEQVLNVM